MQQQVGCLKASLLQCWQNFKKLCKASLAVPTLGLVVIVIMMKMFAPLEIEYTLTTFAHC